MSIANLLFSRIFIHLSHPLYIWKHNLQAAIDKEDYGLMPKYTIQPKCGLRIPNIQSRKVKQVAEFYTLDQGTEVRRSRRGQRELTQHGN